MIFSNLVAFFIIVTTATTLNAHGIHDIATAQQAAEALRPLAGRFAELLFTLGMVGTGILAVPVLAGSSAYVAAQTFRFREGLSETPHKAPKFYGILTVGIVIGIAMNLLHIDAIKALFWSAVLNGVAAVPLIAVIVWFASDSSTMGAWKSPRLHASGAGVQSLSWVQRRWECFTSWLGVHEGVPSWRKNFAPSSRRDHSSGPKNFAWRLRSLKKQARRQYLLRLPSTTMYDSPSGFQPNAR